MANSADPDQTPRYAASDLGLTLFALVYPNFRVYMVVSFLFCELKYTGLFCFLISISLQGINNKFDKLIQEHVGLFISHRSLVIVLFCQIMK